ncbi:MAG: hypothetical protein AAGC95_05645 [Pseudomonadota bacterium]
MIVQAAKEVAVADFGDASVSDVYEIVVERRVRCFLKTERSTAQALDTIAAEETGQFPN